MSKINEITPLVLDIHQVTACVGLSKATIYRLIEKKQFPPPLKLASRRVGWPKKAIDQWLNEKMTEQYKEQ